MFAKVWPPRILAELREERRKLHEERKRFLDDLRSVVDDVTRVTIEMRATTDDALRRVGQAITRLENTAEPHPCMGERLCIELLHYWKIDRNWNANAARSLEALAKNGKGDLAQWGAKVLLSGDTIDARGTIGPLLKQLANNALSSPQKNGTTPPAEDRENPE
jgi:hypothetical protein|nr:MAG: hypothetical protein DIU60_22245 [Actinomycetota bacterium]